MADILAILTADLIDGACDISSSIQDSLSYNPGQSPKLPWSSLTLYSLVPHS